MKQNEISTNLNYLKRQINYMIQEHKEREDESKPKFPNKSKSDSSPI